VESRFKFCTLAYRTCSVQPRRTWRSADSLFGVNVTLAQRRLEGDVPRAPEAVRLTSTIGTHSQPLSAVQHQRRDKQYDNARELIWRVFIDRTESQCHDDVCGMSACTAHTRRGAESTDIARRRPSLIDHRSCAVDLYRPGPEVGGVHLSDRGGETRSRSG
jgi:hypothetical protein